MSRLSLRARLVLGTIALGAVGLAVADVATYASLRSFLIDRTDASLEQSHGGIEHAVEKSGCGAGGGRPPLGVDPGDFVQVRTATGAVACSWQLTPLGESAPSPPALPDTIEPSGDGPGQASYVTVPAQEGGERYRVRASIEPRSGATLITATPLTDVDATLRRLLAIMLLVTAAVLAAPRTEVGRLGLALNAMLAQIESAFEAQAASERRLRRFVADASHELRTPLAAVRAYAELFGRGADRRPDDLQRAMTGIGRESERMTVLVEDLLLLARLDEGRPLEREPVELEQVVGEAVETARTVEPERPIDLEAEPAAVLGDRDRLRQIVDNLLGNVRAHTPAGAPVPVRGGAENGHAVIEVADTGPGMTREEAERVFERFYRTDRS